MSSDLITEAPNACSAGIDSLSTLNMLEVISAADQEVAPAVAREIRDIAKAVDAVVERLESGGRLFYIGAGTSGRLGVLDASECPPTFNTPPSQVQAIIAGGDQALRKAVEGAEDDEEAGRQAIAARRVTESDVVVGIAASGTTPF